MPDELNSVPLLSNPQTVAELLPVPEPLPE